MSPELRERIERQLIEWDDPNSEIRKRWEEIKRASDEEWRPRQEALERSMRPFTAEELMITINTRA